MSNILLIKERLRARSFIHAIARLINIFKHYELSNTALRNVIVDFVDFLKFYDITPTFPVTALIVNRHPSLFQKLQDKGIELAIHGFRHVDYALLDADDVHRHLEKAMNLFHQFGINFYGFRFPFLRRTPQATQIVSEYAFDWESSEVISWRFPDDFPLHKKRGRDYNDILTSYQVLNSIDKLSLPWKIGGLLEIPLSVPDDDILAERLGLSKLCIREIWMHILQETRKRGDMFIMQLHPERFPLCRSALSTVIQHARSAGDVWIAPLHKIACWWKKRLNISWQLNSAGPGYYDVIVNGPKECRLTVQSSDQDEHRNRNMHQSFVSTSKPMRLASKVRPIVGIISPIRKEVVDILKQEGYLFEERREHFSYCVTVEGSNITGNYREQLLKQISSVSQPLLRVCRWPDFYRSVLSVTGDIDGLDIWDYWTRFYGK